MATKAPSGLSVKRNNEKFTVSWKVGETYSQQQYCYQLNSKGKDIYETIGASTTSHVTTIDLDGKYYPKKDAKLKNIKFWVRGYTSSGGWSAWSSKTYTILAPSTPKLSASHSDNLENVTTFSWSMPWGSSNKKASSHVLYNYKYWTVLKKESNVASDKVKGWGDGETTSARADSGSKTIAETTVFSGDYSYTRYFKIQARGPNGRSKLVYAKHVYAIPYAAQNVKAKAEPLAGSAGYTVSVQWTAKSNLARPIDSIDVEYAIETPVTSYTDSGGVRKVTVTAPYISSWTSVGSVKDTDSKKKDGDKDGLSFKISGTIEEDKCIFVRVVTKHDNKVNYSATTFVENGYGKLTAPSGFTASIDDDIATIAVTNGSAITASYVGIFFRTDTDPNEKLIGIKPAGSASNIEVKLPSMEEAENFSLGVQTFLSDYSPITPEQNTATYYTRTNEIAASEKIIWDERPVPKPPTNVDLSSPRNGVVRVKWDWTWLSANGVELSWADHNDAWESTDGPQTYTVESTRTTAWNVAGLDYGEWYFRVRLFKMDGESVVYGTYSEIKSIKIAASPATPVLTLSSSIASPDGSVTCYWVYTATDGDEQASAEIREVTLNSSGVPVAYIDIGMRTENEQYKTLKIQDIGWAAGSTHYLAVRIITVSGEESDNWSTPVKVDIIEPITAAITSTSLVPIYVLTDDTVVESNKKYYTRSGSGTTQDPYVYTQVTPAEGSDPSALGYYEIQEFHLTELPLSVTATGSDESSSMTYILERDEDYHLDRPDESESTGFKGETVSIIDKSANTIFSITEDTTVDASKEYYIRSGTGSDDDPYIYTEVTPAEGSNPHTLGYYEVIGYDFATLFELEDLINPLDDGVRYKLIAVAQDTYGQKDDDAVEFVVHWDHQAVKPTAEVTVDNDKMVVFIKPILPSSGYVSGDVCDIYRLSADKPELIVEGATFGTKYVDPYPTLGKFGGHRVVYRTINGDYITQDNEFAWENYDVTTGDCVNRFATVIDFEEGQIILPYDLSLSNKWAKDFTMTKYLGGSIQGDWNPAVERTGSVKTRVAVEHDSDLITMMRRLANYAGICHVRTPDGSSYAANVNISEDREEKKINMIATFSLEITKIDPEGFDGIAYDDWIVSNS